MTSAIQTRDNAFISGEGWRVETHERGAIRYRDGFVGASVEAEMMPEGPFAYVIYRSRIRPRWWSLKRRFSKADRGLICDRIRQAFRAVGSDVDIAR